MHNMYSIAILVSDSKVSIQIYVPQSLRVDLIMRITYVLHLHDNLYRYYKERHSRLIKMFLLWRQLKYVAVSASVSFHSVQIEGKQHESTVKRTLKAEGCTSWSIIAVQDWKSDNKEY